MLNTLDFNVMVFTSCFFQISILTLLQKQNLNEIMQKHDEDNDMMELGFKYYFLIRTLVDYEKGDVCIIPFLMWQLY